MQSEQTPALLARLQETVDDPEIFDLSYIDEPEAFKKELRAAWATLYDNAMFCWGDMLFLWDEECYMDRPEVFGPDMCERFMPLSSCWLESFTKAARRAARSKNLPSRLDRAFILFMLGVMHMSWQLHIRDLQRSSAGDKDNTERSHE